MKFKFKTLLIMGVVIFTIISCHHHHSDPCPSSSTRTSADFTVAQVVTNFETNYYNLNCDTCVQGELQFSLKDNSAESVKWKIGSDTTTFTKKSFNLNFPDSILTLPITCIVRKSPNTKCFPDDDGVDTVTKVIVIKGFYNRLYFGTFHGYNIDSPSQYFDIKLSKKDTTNQCDVCSGCNDYLNVHNLPEGLDDPRVCLLPDCDGTYKSFKITTNSSSLGNQIDGIGSIDDANHNKVTINYSYIPKGSSNRINKTFIGYRQ